MTLGNISTPALSMLGIGSFLLNFLFLAVMIRRRIAGLSRKINFICLPAMALCMVLMLNVTEVCRCTIGRMPPSIFESYAEGLNAYLCLGITISMMVLWAVLWLRQEMDIRNRLTPKSLEDGLNRLTDGVAFATTQGVPLFVNSTMQCICREALGIPLFDSRVMEFSLQKNRLCEGCRSEIRGKGYYLHLKDGRVCDIRKRLINIDGVKVWELTAYDVTERYQKSRELEERNEHLKEVNLRLRDYNNEMNALIREEEVLAAKIRIHDDVGRALLALKSYLIRGGDRAALMELWQFTAGILKGENEPDDSADPIGALREAAEAVGVRLTLNGEIPDDMRKVLVIAIHECLTNTVKHADGSELTVDLTDEDGVMTAVFTNDGKPPEGEISEKGGLKSLRTAVEQVWGEMELAAVPQFRLTIRVDRKE